MRPPCFPVRLSRGRRWAVLAAGAAATAAAGALYWVPPRANSIYPPCLFHALTGLHCPGCGTARCLHALLHGELQQALAYNVLTVLSLPYLVAWGCRLQVEALLGRHWQRRPLRVWVIPTILAVIVGFWVLRNLPVWPFNLLAPHTL